jgi:hypothetical protein
MRASRSAAASEPAVLGFRVKSGRAVVVLLSGSAARPVLAARREIQLADPEQPGTYQPFHDSIGVHTIAAKRATERLVTIVEKCARRSMTQLLDDAVVAGKSILGAALVVGSVIDPSTIGNDHIRAHAEEGRLFRTVLAGACESVGLRTETFVEKELLYAAGKKLRRPPARLRTVVNALGRGEAGPWRADEKSAALAAWVLLAAANAE